MQRRALVWLTGLLVAAAAVAATDNEVAHDAAGAGAPSASGLCGRCKCEGVTVLCTCSDGQQNLEVTPELVGDAGTLKKFEVRGCPILSLKRNAFRSAAHLQTLFVENVFNATFETGVFQELESLLVQNVSALNLHKSAFQGVVGLNSIRIKGSLIPSLPQWSLYGIKELQELVFENVKINAIEKEAIFIDMKHAGSKAEINQCTIGKIEAEGLRVGNATQVILTNNEILVAEQKSIRVSSRNAMVLKGNTFQTNVNVDAALILYNQTIEFSNNSLLNVDISNIINLGEMPDYTPTHTLERLVAGHAGNKVQCRCLDNVTNTTGVFFQNVCVRGCSESTVDAFLKHCQANKALQDAERFRDICKNSIPQTTPSSVRDHNAVTSFSNDHHGSTMASVQKNNTNNGKPQNGAQRTSVYILPLLAFSLFHVVL